MITINLTKNKSTIVDDQYRYLAQYNWYLHEGYNTAYARRDKMTKLIKTRIYLHVEIMEQHLGRKLLKGEEVDHINGNGLDNRLENLRVATSQQNKANQRLSISNTTGYKGVSFSKFKNKYRAYIGKDNISKQTFLGYFVVSSEAAKMYDRAALYFFGEFARLNFPELREQYLDELKRNKYNWM